MLNLDTHIFIDALIGNLTQREQKILLSDQWSISAIVLWEMAKLCQLKRIQVDFKSIEMRQAISQVHIWPISYEVCCQIGDLDFRGDPADEIIASTSIVYRIPLITRDRQIKRSKQVPFAS